MPVLLGAIADDFTGATDLANTLVRHGMRTVQLIGTPTRPAPEDVDAVVVALKSRTIPAADAVAQSLAALLWLQAASTRQIFFKYCSTFDSTDCGNIGPVADALMEALRTDLTVFCPAFPENGRTIYRGYLFVGDVLLSESGMRDHPLTPMRDANLVRVLERQTPHKVGLMPLQAVRRGPEEVRSEFARLRREGCRHADPRRGGRRRSHDAWGRARRLPPGHRRFRRRSRITGKFPPRRTLEAQNGRRPAASGPRASRCDIRLVLYGDLGSDRGNARNPLGLRRRSAGARRRPAGG